MNNKIKNVIKKRKNNLQERLKNDNQESTQPVFSAKRAAFEISEKISAVHCGGIGVVNDFVNTTRLPKKINSRIQLLKRHKPYFESDHILNMAYNIICGGKNIEDIELLRNNTAYLDSLGVQRIPDPTTAGDFLRRFDEKMVLELMEVMNETTAEIWKNTRGEKPGEYGIIDVDGTIQETFAECKEGMDMSYKGKWGFSALVTTEAVSGAHLYVVNRPGNKLSQEGAGEWIDKSIDVVNKGFKKVYLRGDSAFSLTWKMDEWTERGTQFIFGYDNRANLVKEAENIGINGWKALEKEKKKTISGKERKKKFRVKQAMVEKRKYRNIKTKKEFVSEFRYRPVKCKKEYRVIVLKKIIDVTQGQQYLFEDSRYLFYITNIEDMSAEQALRFIQGRCNHENKIEQLDNGIHALKMPAAEFMANWAYMAIITLAWNLKSWIAHIIPDEEKKREIIACEFKSFQNKLINIPCQIIRAGRRIIFRYLNYNLWIDILLKIPDTTKRLKFEFV